MSLRTTVYSPEAHLRAPRMLVGDMLSDLRASFGLAERLAIRDMRAQYRGSVLGFLWAFITPVMNTAMWLFLNSTGIVRVTSTGMPYAAYIFTGTMIWQLFTESLTSPIAQVNGARAMLAKLNFPREALILSGLLKTLFSAGVKVIILVPAVLLLGVYPDVHLLLFPFAAVSIILFGSGIGLLLAPLGMLYKDIGRVIPIASQFLMYISPVLFAMPTAGLTARLFRANPMSPLVLTARAWLTGSSSPMFGGWLAVSACAVVLILLGWLFYRITMPVLVERMSS